jgi:hypothetical protein
MPPMMYPPLIGSQRISIADAASWIPRGREVDEEVVTGDRERLSELSISRPDPTGIIVFLLVVQLVTLFFIGTSFYLASRQAKEAAEDARKGVACMIEQMAEHRFAQHSAHAADAQNHGYNFEQPFDLRAPSDPEAQSIRRALIVNCAGFLPDSQRVPVP